MLDTRTLPEPGNPQLSQEVALLSWSGDAELTISITYDNVPYVAGLASPPAPPPRAAQVAAATAIGHDVLAALPRS
jgi:hypothetical protein